MLRATLLVYMTQWLTHAASWNNAKLFGSHWGHNLCRNATKVRCLLSIGPCWFLHMMRYRRHRDTCFSCKSFGKRRTTCSSAGGVIKSFFLHICYMSHPSDVKWCFFCVCLVHRTFFLYEEPIELGLRRDMSCCADSIDSRQRFFHSFETCTLALPAEADLAFISLLLTRQDELVHLPLLGQIVQLSNWIYDRLNGALGLKWCG